MTPYDAHGPATYSMVELILGGDWACGENQAGTLAALATELAARCRPDERHRFLDIAAGCDADMVAATCAWLTATAPLRGRCGQPGPRHDDTATPTGPA